MIWLPQKPSLLASPILDSFMKMCASLRASLAGLFLKNKKKEGPQAQTGASGNVLCIQVRRRIAVWRLTWWMLCLLVEDGWSGFVGGRAHVHAMAFVQRRPTTRHALFRGGRGVFLS